MPPRRLLTVGHSYVVALNRRLADELARVGAGRWEVTAVAPQFMPGDLRPIPFEPAPRPEACRTITVPVRFARQIHLMAYSRALRPILRQDWDLVHCWEEPYVVAGAQVGWWTPARTPFVFWTAQNLSKWYPPPFNWFEKYCLGRCAGWLACGETVVATLGRRGYAAKPHRVAPLGVDVDAFRPDPAAGAAVRGRLGWEPGGPPVVGYLGRFVPEKGLGLLTRALDRVRAPWRALFVGGGPLERVLGDWARARPDRVRVLTGVPHDQVPAYLNAMDVLAAPSQTTPSWREQFGRMLIEAFACGVAVAGSDSGEIPHVVADAGLVVPEQDEAAWAAALERLLTDDRLRAELVERGHGRVGRYSWAAVGRQYLEFFESLLDRRGEPGG